MKTKLYNLIIPAVLAITMTSCCVYNPHLTNIPLHNEKGELQISAGLQTDLLMSASVNADASYALTNHIAVMGHADIEDVDRYYAGVGAGYFMPFANKSVFEAYVGTGYGKSNYENSDNAIGDSTFHSHSTPLYLQFNYGFRDLTSAHIDVGASLKGGALFYNYEDIFQTSSYKEDGTCAMIEPQLFFRFGSQKCKFQIQIGYCWLLEDGKEPDFTYSPYAIGAGVNLHF